MPVLFCISKRKSEKGFSFSPPLSPLEATDKEQAFLLALEKCAGSPYQPDPDSMALVIPSRYNRIPMRRLLGKRIRLRGGFRKEKDPQRRRIQEIHDIGVSSNGLKNIQEITKFPFIFQGTMEIFCNHLRVRPWLCGTIFFCLFLPLLSLAAPDFSAGSHSSAHPPFPVHLHSPTGLLSAAGGPGDPPVTYFVGTREIGIILSPDGRILRIKYSGNTAGRPLAEHPLTGFSWIRGFRQSGKTVVRRNKEGALLFTRTLVNDSLRRSTATSRKNLYPRQNNAYAGSWEIIGRDCPWSEVKSIPNSNHPVSEQTRFWTAWGSPQYDTFAVSKQLREDLRPVPGGSEMGGFIGAGNNQWADPLVAVPFSNASFFYGLPYFKYEDPRIAVCPFQGNLFCIPLCFDTRGRSRISA